MNRSLLLAFFASALLGAGIGAGYWFAQRSASVHAAAPSSTAGTESRKPLYWHDPMNPQQKFDKPGKSPYMDMMLVPVYAETGPDGSGVKISSRVVQNLGIRTAEVIQGTLGQKVEAVGAVAFDERQVAVVPARVAGIVERLYVRALLDPVAKGQALAEILAPDWVAAQEEYLALRRSPHANEPLREAARQRLGLLGVPEATISAIEADGRARSRITLTAPIGGVVAELGVREGMSVMPGTTLFRINGLGTVWVNAEVPESQAALVKTGGMVSASVPAYPGEAFAAQIAALLPEVNAATRTLKARIEIANPQGRLKPGMFATIDFAAGPRREVLLVPSEAIIRTGQRSVIVVAEPAGSGEQHFRVQDIEVGAEAGGKTEVRKGLARGMKVVVSGQFLIDSEASLKGAASRLGETEGTYQAEGTVERISKGSITLSHGPVPALKWGEMTMEFMAPEGILPAHLKTGTHVSFSFKRNAKGEFEVTSITPHGVGGARP